MVTLRLKVIISAISPLNVPHETQLAHTFPISIPQFGAIVDFARTAVPVTFATPLNDKAPEKAHVP